MISPTPASWNPDDPIVDYEVPDGLLLPGRRVLLDDNAKPKGLINSDIAVTLVNIFTDCVDGNASPGMHLETGFCNDNGARCAMRRMVVGDDGKWFADCTPPTEGDVPADEKVTVEITLYNYSTATVRDDGDVTVMHWVGIIPIIEANLSDNLIWTYDWPSRGDTSQSRYGHPSEMNSGDMAFVNTFDIKPGFANNARVFDEDRDNTSLLWVAPNTRIEAWIWDQANDAVGD